MVYSKLLFLNYSTFQDLSAFIFCLFTLSLCGQNPQIFWHDGDSDGSFEQITYHRSAGNYFFQKTLVITDTISGETDQFEWEGSIGQFSQKIPLTNALQASNKKYLIEDFAWAVSKKPIIYGHQPATAALFKLHSQIEQGDREKALPGCQFWEKGNWEAPKLNVHYLTQEDPLQSEEAPFLYIYYGHNHNSNGFKIETMALAKGDTLLISRHGLIRQQKDRYTWLFHSDEGLGAPEKLRWKSFSNLLVHGELLFVLQRSVEKRLLIFHWPSGRWLIQSPEGLASYQLTSTHLQLVPLSDTPMITIPIHEIKARFEQP